MATTITKSNLFSEARNNIVDIISANVTELQGVSTVRINAVAKRMNSEGEILETSMITEPTYYEGIFKQIEKSVFLEQNLN